MKDWLKGEIEVVFGCIMFNFVIVECDYIKIYDKYVMFGFVFEKGKVGVYGVSFGVSE